MLICRFAGVKRVHDTFQAWATSFAQQKRTERRTQEQGTVVIEVTPDFEPDFSHLDE